MGIIGKIVWSPLSPKAGESVKVDVCDAAGNRYENKNSDYIAINGVAGSSHYVQFALAGKYRLFICAVGEDRKTEEATVDITVDPPTVSRSTEKLMGDAAFQSENPHYVAWLKAVNDVRVLNASQNPPYAEPYKIHLRLTPLGVFIPAPLVKGATKGEAKAQAAEAETYMWDFGDGSKSVTTSSASVFHDYSAVLNTTDENKQFHASVAVTSGGQTLGTWSRTVTVHNPYVSGKKQGHAVLTVEAKGWARKTSGHFVATAKITNPESAPTKFGYRTFIPIAASDDDTPPPAAAEKLDTPLEVPAHGWLELQVSAPFSVVPAHSQGFAVVFSENKEADEGKKDDPIAGLKVRATGYFRLPPSASLAKAKDQKKDDPKKNDPGDDSAFKVGNPCDPDNLPENIPPGFVCQVTHETQTIGLPGRFLNARKGDVVLCPKGTAASSLVDGIFGQLTPPQQYGHSGIMTRDYEQITHCTASQPRMITYTEGNVLSSQDEGLDPDAVKYGWPATITEKVDEAVNGQYYTDPASSTGAQYQLQSFNSSFSALPCGSALTIIPPLVVKPDPLLETAEIRKTLTEVADDAYSNTGKFHYRFYVFTDAAHATDAPKTGLDSSSTWAAGTHAGVCSAFVWKMMKGRGVHAVGDSKYASQSELSSYAVNVLGLQVDPNGTTEDGLFYYTEPQRLKCGQWLWQQIYNDAAGQAGGFAEFLSGAAYYYADQVCNAFAADDAQTPSEPPLVGGVLGDLGFSNPVKQPWQSPGGGSAISPDNFLAWIGPDKGGVLGYNEPLSYEPPMVATVPVYKWAKVDKYGRVKGKVTLDGKPAAHVTLTLPGLQAGTDAEGDYIFDKVPYGPCLLKAIRANEAPTGATIDSIRQVRFDVDKDDVEAPEIKLRPPSDPSVRTVTVSGNCSLDCSEWELIGNGHHTAWPEFAGQVDVGYGATYQTWSATETSKDATAQLSATINFNDDDDSVDVVFTAALDQPGGRSLTYSANIPPGKSHTFVIGNSSSWLNGSGPDKWTYNGYPDLEAKNDTLCCSATFTNNEWVG